MGHIMYLWNSSWAATSPPQSRDGTRVHSPQQGQFTLHKQAELWCPADGHIIGCRSMNAESATTTTATALEWVWKWSFKVVGSQNT